MAEPPTPSFPEHSDMSSLLNEAVRLHGTGDLQKAEIGYRQVLERHKDHPVALHYLGVIAHQTGNNEAAVPLLERAISLNPGDAEAPYNLGLVLGALKRWQSAQTAFETSLALKPENPNALFHLANIFLDQGKVPEALSGYDRVLALDPDRADAHKNKGNALRSLSRFEEAVESYQAAVNLRPELAEAHFNLGLCFTELGQLDQAISSYRKTIVLLPEYSKTYLNLGIVHKQMGDLNEAVANYQQAIALAPDDADTHYNLANVLHEMGKLDDAVASYQQAINHREEFADAHYNLAVVFKDRNSLEEAIRSYHKAIALKPSADAYSNLGSALKEAGDISQAVMNFEKALALEPASLRHALNAWLSQPVLMDSLSSIDEWRGRYLAGLSRLENSARHLQWQGEDLAFDRFYLAYHNKNNRDLNRRLSDALRDHSEALNWVAPHLREERPKDLSSGKTKVGILSRYLRKPHTIGKLYQGLIDQLDRDRFDLVIFHAPDPKGDRFTDLITAGQSDNIVHLSVGLKDQQKEVSEERLDLLFFPDLGMDASTYLLAHSRLAPVQAMAWGHPDTIGIDTIDYFISSERIEPENAQDHYQEQLIQLTRLPCYYPDLSTQVKPVSRAELGLPAKGTLYGCPQSLYKFHPDFDPVLADILRGDPQGWLILIEGRTQTWSDQLRQRWQRVAPELVDRVRFLPFMPRDRFLALQAHMDVLLDPIHYGAGNTMYEAMGAGTPIVTWPGQFMRARIAAGAYEQMGIQDPPVVEAIKDYAVMAVALGLDPEKRQKMAAEISAAARKYLYADQQVVQEFGTFFEAAVQAARNGERLAADWRP